MSCNLRLFFCTIAIAFGITSGQAQAQALLGPIGLAPVVIEHSPMNAVRWKTDASSSLGTHDTIASSPAPELYLAKAPTLDAAYPWQLEVAKHTTDSAAAADNHSLNEEYRPYDITLRPLVWLKISGADSVPPGRVVKLPLASNDDFRPPLKYGRTLPQISAASAVSTAISKTISKIRNAGDDVVLDKIQAIHDLIASPGVFDPQHSPAAKHNAKHDIAAIQSDAWQFVLNESAINPVDSNSLLSLNPNAPLDAIKAFQGQAFSRADIANTVAGFAVARELIQQQPVLADHDASDSGDFEVHLGGLCHDPAAKALGAEHIPAVAVAATPPASPLSSKRATLETLWQTSKRAGDEADLLGQRFDLFASDDGYRDTGFHSIPADDAVDVPESDPVDELPETQEAYSWSSSVPASSFETDATFQWHVLELLDLRTDVSSNLPELAAAPPVQPIPFACMIDDLQWELSSLGFDDSHWLAQPDRVGRMLIDAFAIAGDAFSGTSTQVIAANLSGPQAQLSKPTGAQPAANPVGSDDEHLSKASNTTLEAPSTRIASEPNSTQSRR